MLYFLSNLSTHFGPFRLFSSHLFLMGLGIFFASFLTFWAIPKYKHLLPTDRGKSLACEGEKSKGKPQSAGLIFITIFAIICFLVIPPTNAALPALFSVICIYLAMLTGFLDDIAKKPWGQLRKGILDLIISILAAGVICRFEGMEIWLPFTKEIIFCPAWCFITISTPILWLMINSTNCSDGVDGLAGTLSIFPLLFFAVFLYLVAGHQIVAKYLLLPHYDEGAALATMFMVLIGAISSYLWYNCEPSEVLMGDAGSRAIGLALGIGVISSGNFVLMFVAAPVILINGGGGMVKILLIRFLKKLGFATEKNENAMVLVKMIHRYRFPLHDHYRKEKGWKNSQVLMRFSIIQIWILLILFAVIIKFR